MKKLLATLLAAASLLTSLSACANTDDDAAETTVGETQAVTEAETDDPLKDNLPEDLNYGGETITIISREREGWTSGELTVDEQNGDVVNDAVYERNKVVENRLGVEIENIKEDAIHESTVVDKVRLAVNSNSGDYDIAAGANYVILGASTEGIFADLRTSQYLDFEQPWWMQEYNEAVEFQGRQFAVTGPICLSMYRFALITFFNKNLFEKASIEYPYDKVRNYEWTMDYQMSLIPMIASDDGNGQPDFDLDTFGFATTSTSMGVDPYWGSCGIDIIGRDENGEYKYVLDIDRLDAVADKILDLFYSQDGVWLEGVQIHGLEQDNLRKLFTDGRCGMVTMKLAEVEMSEMRNMEDDYGVLPMPVYDTNQKKYGTLQHDQFTVLCVPTTVSGDDLDKVSAVLEAMAVEGARYITPAYYETALRYKHMSDPDSWEMLNIIFDNVYVDAGVVYTAPLEGFYGNLRTIIQAKVNTVSSTYKGLKRKVANNIKKLNTSLSEVGLDK